MQTKCTHILGTSTPNGCDRGSQEGHTYKQRPCSPSGLFRSYRWGCRRRSTQWRTRSSTYPSNRSLIHLLWLGGATANCQHFGRPFFLSKSPLKMPRADHHSTNNQNCNLCPVLGASPAFPFAGECKWMSEHFSIEQDY